MLAELVDARGALRSLGGDRLHSNYMPGASEQLMASVKLQHAVTDQDFADVHALAVSDTQARALPRSRKSSASTP